MKYLSFFTAITATAFLAVSCAIATPVMDHGNGVYMISSPVSPIGGISLANRLNYDQAQKFCKQRNSISHAVIVKYIESTGSNPSEDFYFKCEK